MTDIVSNDIRQRFFFQNSPVRGDAVRLEKAYAYITSQKDYPTALKLLLGEMLTAASLLIGTLKINGSLSIQIQSTDADTLLTWAMAECDHNGKVRALAGFKNSEPEHQAAWQSKSTANQAFAELGEVGKGVLFINIHPEKGESYQGIVERSHDNLADCLAHYQMQSAQIPTLINLACDGLQAGGLLVQRLPLNKEEQLASERGDFDEDLWTRLSMLTRTVKPEELTKLTTSDILFRLYHEEEIVMPEPVALAFGCTCSREKSQSAILQLGKQEALEVAAEQNGVIELDCAFCGAVYKFDENDILNLFV